MVGILGKDLLSILEIYADILFSIFLLSIIFLILLLTILFTFKTTKSGVNKLFDSILSI